MSHWVTDGSSRDDGHSESESHPADVFTAIDDPLSFNKSNSLLDSLHTYMVFVNNLL